MVQGERRSEALHALLYRIVHEVGGFPVFSYFKIVCNVNVAISKINFTVAYTPYYTEKIYLDFILCKHSIRILLNNPNPDIRWIAISEPYQTMTEQWTQSWHCLL